MSTPAARGSVGEWRGPPHVSVSERCCPPHRLLTAAGESGCTVPLLPSAESRAGRQGSVGLPCLLGRAFGELLPSSPAFTLLGPSSAPAEGVTPPQAGHLGLCSPGLSMSCAGTQTCFPGTLPTGLLSHLDHLLRTPWDTGERHGLSPQGCPLLGTLAQSWLILSSLPEGLCRSSPLQGARLP